MQITAKEYQKLMVLDQVNFDARTEWQKKWSEVYEMEERTHEDFEKLGSEPPPISTYLIVITDVESRWVGNTHISETTYHWNLEALGWFSEGVKWARERGFDFIPEPVKTDSEQETPQSEQ